jgi:uncharacterized membrane protein (UPF0127 family)
MNSIYIIILIFLIAFICFFVFGLHNSQSISPYTYNEQITLGNTPFSVARVTNMFGWARGLSGRQPLTDSQGLLFVFYVPGNYSIWMKDMLFPIDVFWLDKNGVVVTIKKNFLPSSYPEQVSPTSKALYVLETSAGVAERDHIEIGATLKFSQTTSSKTPVEP